MQGRNEERFVSWQPQAMPLLVMGSAMVNVILIKLGELHTDILQFSANFRTNLLFPNEILGGYSAIQCEHL